MTTTILMDINGTIVKHDSLPDRQQLGHPPPALLPGTLDKLREWGRKGYKVILTTARKSCWRALTEKELADAGVWYDQLVMDLGCGPRFLINDLKPGSDAPMAVAINLPRDVGIGGVDIP